MTKPLPDAPENVSPKEDLAKTNPGLHLLYVKWACEHLTVIDRMTKEAFDFSNGNMMEVAWALQKVRAKLVKENPAYAEASEICALIEKARKKGRKPRRNDA